MNRGWRRQNREQASKIGRSAKEPVEGGGREMEQRWGKEEMKGRSIDEEGEREEEEATVE